MKHNFYFIWKKYTGFLGCIRFLSYFVGIGLVVSPFVLNYLNDDIWQMIRQAEVRTWIAQIVFLAVVFSVLPFLTLGIVLWKFTNLYYLQSTTKEARYKDIGLRTWHGNDRLWHCLILSSAGLSIIFGFVVLGLALGHNVPTYYGYPFITICALGFFSFAYAFVIDVYSGFKNGDLHVPVLFKVVFVSLVVLVILSLLNLMIGIEF